MTDQKINTKYKSAAPTNIVPVWDLEVDKECVGPTINMGVEDLLSDKFSWDCLYPVIIVNIKTERMSTKY